MKQQINLYQERFHVKRAVLPARRIAAIEAVLVVCLIAVSGLMQWSVERAEARQAELAEKQKTLQESVTQAAEAAGRQSIDKELEARVARVNQQLSARRQVLQWVTESQDRNEVAFSALLAGPGRRHVQGLWLSGIAIEQAGAALRLEGNVVDAGLVPEFLTALQQEPAYYGREFRKLILEQSDETAGMRFLLTTLPPRDNAVTLNKRNSR